MSWDVTSVEAVCDGCGKTCLVRAIGGRPGGWFAVIGPWPGAGNGAKASFTKLFCSSSCLDEAVSDLPTLVCNREPP